MDHSIFKSTVLNIYPSYTKKAMLKQAVKDGFVIDQKKRSAQMTLNFSDCMDVSDDATLDAKIKHLLESERFLALAEAYDYKKPYRHFCYFEITALDFDKIKELVTNGMVNVFGNNERRAVDDTAKPTLYQLEEEGLTYLKFSYILKNETGNKIKYVMLAVIDKENGLLEIRFDRVGIAYKNSYHFYKQKIETILQYLYRHIGLAISDIDFKAVVDYMKTEKDDITIVAQRMTRNGTTAYLEAYADEAGIIPILGELNTFIEKEKDLFERDGIRVQSGAS